MTTRTRPRPIAVLVAAALSVATALPGITAPAAAQAPPNDGMDLSRYEGIAYPSIQVVLNAPIDGKVASILFEEGDRVEAGALLAQIDDTEQRVVVQSARLQSESIAEIERARFALEEAIILLDRATESYEADAASEWEVRRNQLQKDQAEADLQIARDRKALAEVNLELEQERLARMRVLAPFDGEVIEHNAEVGATLTRDDPILAVAKLDPLEAHINLPVSIFSDLRIGRTYQLVAGEPINATIPGELKHIYRIIDTASETVRCVFEIDNPDAELIAGFPVKLGSMKPIE